MPSGCFLNGAQDDRRRKVLHGRSSLVTEVPTHANYPSEDSSY
jgi:hypothetical protein